MKAYFWLPFACLAGLLVGAWGPRAEIREMKRLAQEEKSRPRNPAADGFKAFTNLANIPDEAKRPRRRRADGKDRALFRGTTNRVEAAVARDVSAAGAAASAAPTNGSPASKQEPPKRMSPEDLRARIEEAQDLWRTRAEVARATWRDRLKLTPEAAAKFGAALDEMNEHLYETMQTMAQLVAKSDKVTHELGLRLVGDATAIMAETYEKVGAFVPAEMRGAVSEMPMTDFIDPGVAEPLIAVQDKFERFPRGIVR